VKPSRGRVVSEAELLREVDACRAAGRRVVLTNGAFDLVHVGHVRMLEEAARLGDVLVVAVNDDAAVAAQKGPGRPVVPAAERAEVVAALPGVDLACVVPDATMDRLLARLRPAVHAKGRDYDAASHPEGATNRGLGVEMAFVGDAKDHGSRDLAARAGAAAAAADRLVEVEDASGARGWAPASRRAFLAAHGLLDLRGLLARTDGVETNRHATRVVRRVAAGGRTLFVKAEWAPSKRARLQSGGAVSEARHHWALRAAGFRAPEPWLALEGRREDGRRAGALVLEPAAGAPLDEFLRARLASAPARERAAWARGLGAALRALHTARFLPPDLHAHHLFVDGTPAGGTRSLTWIDLARLDRARARVGPSEAAPGLASLALTLRPVTPRRFRLRVLRAYLGGRLAEARPWLRALDRRIRRVEGRGTFRRLATGVP
jgi:rfaE bifunctional protein nucleotidyltransferase chain/domain